MKYAVLGYDCDDTVYMDSKFRLISSAFACFKNASYYRVELIDLDSAEILGVKDLGEIKFNAFNI